MNAKTLLLGSLFLISGPSYAVVNVYFSSSVPTLQNEFIAQTTNQYMAVVTPSPYFAGTYSMTISGKKNYTPPAISSPIADATAVDRCMTYGFAWGMESERMDSLNMIYDMAVGISSTSTCGGLKVSTTSTKTPQNYYLDGCSAGYMHVSSSITQRNGLDPKILK